MARLNRRVATTATAFVAVLALAACGDGTSAREKNAYAQEVNAAQQRFASTVSSVSQQTGSNSIRTQQRTLRRFETAISGVVKELNAIEPPSEVTKEHERLTTVMTGFGEAIGQANDAMKNPTTKRIETAQRDVATATSSVNARVSAAIAAINAKLRAK